MLNLSDDSLRRVMECLESQKDHLTVFRFIKCSFAINQIAVKNRFDKINGAKLRIFKTPDDFNGEDDPILSEEEVVYAEVGPEGPSHQESTESYFDFHVSYVTTKRFLLMELPVATPGGSVNLVAAKILIDILQKVKTLKVFELMWFRLDREFLDILKQFSEELRTVTDVRFQSCLIEWTEDEMMEFLMLFDRLDSLELSVYFRNPIITDKHLSLVHKNVYILSESENTLHFPGITSKICEIWSENNVKSVRLDGLSTAISLSAINTLIEKFSKQKLRTELDFGKLESSESEHRRIVFAQRRRNTKWRIIERRGGMVDYLVCVKGRLTYQFSMKKPYRTPNLVEEVKQLINFSDALVQDDVHDRAFSHVENYLLNFMNRIDEYELRISTSLPSPRANNDVIEEQNHIMNNDDNNLGEDMDQGNASDQEDEEDDLMFEEDFYDEDGFENDEIRRNHWRQDILQKLEVASRRCARLLSDVIEKQEGQQEDKRENDIV